MGGGHHLLTMNADASPTIPRLSIILNLNGLTALAYALSRTVKPSRRYSMSFQFGGVGNAAPPGGGAKTVLL